MTKKTESTLISIIIPVYNEQEGLQWFHHELLEGLSKVSGTFEIIYINDGSKDASQESLEELPCTPHCRLKIIELSRNFGKEAALSAGLAQAEGQAAIALDADGQHPVERIGDFIEKWKQGSEVVIGVRSSNQKEGFIKKYGSKVFYSAFNKITGIEMIPRSTDFRLLDRRVVDEFNKLQESNRITRGLIDWLGFKRDYIEFDAKARQFGTAGYTFKKLTQLAVNTFISLSAVPLFLSGYLGLMFMGLGLFAGVFVLIEQVLLNDPLRLSITGTAMLGILTIFLAGVILSAQGLTGLYISRVLDESQRRPLYIIRSLRKRNKT